MRWEQGRQPATSAVKKWKLWSRWSFDVYLLRAYAGTEVRAHTDPVARGMAHHRINITLSGSWNFKHKERDTAQWTSETLAGGASFQFRADAPHSAKFDTDVLLLSIGWIKKLP